MGMERKPEAGGTAGIPRELALLLPREREIAEVVYELEAATANDVLERLSDPLANASVRSMLNRLVRKGILARFLAGRVFVYFPALTPLDSRRLALLRFADDHFSGSVALAAQTMQQLLAVR